MRRDRIALHLRIRRPQQPGIPTCDPVIPVRSYYAVPAALAAMVAALFSSASFSREHELISVGIFEDRHGSPDFGLRIYGELHAFGLQYFGGCENIITPERYRLKVADAVFVAVRSKE